MTVVLTTTEFAELNKIEYPIAMGLINYLKGKGLVTVAGQRPAKGGKGKPSTLFNIPTEMTVKFAVPPQTVPIVNPEDTIPDVISA